MVTCWTTEGPEFGFRFDKTKPIHQTGLTILLDETVEVEDSMKDLDAVLPDFMAYAKTHYKNIFCRPNPRLGVEEVQIR